MVNIDKWEGVETFTAERVKAEIGDSFLSIGAMERKLGEINAKLNGTNFQMEELCLRRIRINQEFQIGTTTEKIVKVGDKSFEIISVPSENPSGFVLRLFGPIPEV